MSDIRRARLVRVALCLLASILFLSSCASPPESADQRTLASFRRLDRYPFYTMTYHGDYGFAERIGGDPRDTSAALEASTLAAEPIRRPGSEEIDSLLAWACTTFASRSPGGDALLGRNFDWHNRATLLLFTDPPDAYASATMVDLAYLEGWEDDRQALLEAPYYPFDGMNEHGLAIGMMALSRAQGPHDPSRPTLGSLGIIRLLLDYARDVEEAVALLGRFNISFQGGPPVHYLMADRAGASAVMEYIGGEMRVLLSEAPWQVSTNFIISEERPQGADSSCRRYNAAYGTLEAAEGQVSIDQAMALLGETAQTNTMWSVVYDLAGGEIRVALGRDYGNIHELELEINGR